MKEISYAAICAALLMTGCASGKLKQLQAKSDSCELNAGELRKQVHEGEDKIAALQGQIKDLESQAADVDGKLKALQERNDSLTKSNHDLSSSMAADKGEISGKLAEVVKEKDDLARSLDVLKNDKITLSRTRTNLKAAKDKLTAELAAAKTQVAQLSSAAAAAEAGKTQAQAERSARLTKTHEDMGSVADAVLKEIQAEQAQIEQKSESIVLTLQEPLLFKPQQAKLTEDGVALLDRLGRTLQTLGPRDIRVEAHSDNSNIKWELFGSFTSHWDLTAARATAVARYLHEHSGLDPRRLTASGFGEFRPVQGNDTPEGRAANRRVVLVLAPTSSAP